MEKRAISTAGLHSKGFSDIPFDRIQLIVCLTGTSFEHLIPRSFSGEIIRWHVQDPYGEALSVFRGTLETTEWLVRTKLPRWLKLAFGPTEVPDHAG